MSDGIFTCDELFGFQYSETGEREGLRATVVYVARDDVSPLVVEQYLRDHFQSTHAPHRVIVLGPDTERRRTTLRVMQADPRLANTPESIPNSPFEESIEYVLIGPDGELRDLTDGRVWSRSETDRLFSAGLTLLFRVNGAVLDGTAFGTHYVLPSERHQSSLVRVGNVFSRGSQTSFAASALLRLVPNAEYSAIYVDSSSIGALAHELSAQLYDLGRMDERPTVSSFGGYEGLGHDAWPQPGEHSLVLISYSATGGLAAKVLEQHRPPSPDSIVTLFTNDQPPGGRSAACLLGQDNGLTEGAASTFPGEGYMSEKPHTQCDLCDRGQRPIVVKGDQLLPMSPRTHTVAMTIKSVPPDLKVLMKDLITHKAVRANVHAGDGSIPSFMVELQLDLTTLASHLETGADGPILNAVRADLAAAAQADDIVLIVHMDDPVSEIMARYALAEVQKRLPRKQVPIVGLGELKTGNARDLLGSGTVIVVAGVVASGRDIQVVSQLLRTPHAAGAIEYVIFFSRQDSDRQWTRIRYNLTMASGDGDHYSVNTPPRIQLPPTFVGERTSWERERKFWDDWVLRQDQPLLGQPSAPRRLLAAQRVAQLTERERRHRVPQQIVEIGAGLRETLFLDGFGSPALQSDPSSERHLSLRPGFAFWTRDYDELVAVHADVYLTMSSILNWLRNPHGDNAAAIGPSHNRTVIDPADFTRFSDGIVQAAILRAARPTELDYSNDPDLSAVMVRVIAGLVDEEPDGGNALPEFMLALAMDAMRLNPDQLRGLVATLDRKTLGASPATDLLLEILHVRARE